MLVALFLVVALVVLELQRNILLVRQGKEVEH